METQKSTMITTVHYSKDKKERFLLTKEWDKVLPKATVIMLAPGKSGAIQQDVTTCYIVNCTEKLGFGKVDIVNLFSQLEGEISNNIDVKELTNSENDKAILDSAATSENIILAWGKCDETNMKIKERADSVIELLQQYSEKLFLIGDDCGRKGYSPMYPKIRNGWQLVKYMVEEQLEKQQEKKNSNKPKKVDR